MGAIDFDIYSIGKTVQQAYDRAVEDATEEYGTDHYNGTISTTHSVKDLTEEWKRSGLSEEAFVSKKLEECPKWECYAICVQKPKEDKRKIKTKVEHIITPGTKKWLLKYVVYGVSKSVGKFATKGDAVKAARKYTEETGENSYISMAKELEKGNDMVAKVSYKSSGPSIQQKWRLFGVAAC